MKIYTDTCNKKLAARQAAERLPSDSAQLAWWRTPVFRHRYRRRAAVSSGGTDSTMKRGDVFWVGLSAGIGVEVQKWLPAVSSAMIGRTAMPTVSSRPAQHSHRQGLSCEALVLVADRRRKATADQLTTVARERIGASMGSLTAAEMSRPDLAIKLQLAL